MQTPYSSNNAIFSQRAHEAARSQVYPNAFGVDIHSLDFEDTQFRDGGRAKILDGEMGIDRIIKVTSKANLRHPISFTVQERFRRTKFLEYQDITLTEWNNATNEIGEIYKIAASYMVYGYFDDQKNEIISPIVVNVTDMLALICGGELPFSKSKNPRSNQDFLTLKYGDLRKSGCVVYYRDNLSQQNAPKPDSVVDYAHELSQSQFMLTISINSESWDKQKLTKLVSWLQEQGNQDMFQFWITVGDKTELVPFPNHRTKVSESMMKVLLNLFESEGAVKLDRLGK